MEIKNKKSDVGTIIEENGSILASSRNLSDYLQDRVKGFLLSAVPAGKPNIKVEIKVTIE